jgi:nucleoside-diphosphate-sugar epimerase
MKVVVLGASGNAGIALLRALDSEPRVEEVVAVARRPPHEWSSPKTTWRSLDIASDPLEPVMRGADAVVHLAWLIQPARDLEQCRAVNVHGSRRVMAAVGQAGVPTLVYASSVGAYSPGPKNRLVDETWPTDGVPTSFYSRHKVQVERLLDGFELERPEVRVVRLRPALIFQRSAASEIRRLFAGPFLPSPLVAPRWIPIVPRNARLRFQAVHSDDVADAYRRAIVGDARGAFNVAAEPVLDGDALGRLLDARPVPVPARALRAGAAAAFHLRLTPTPAGWVDMAHAVPLMDSSRAREELGWQPRRDAGAALLELLEGIRSSAGFPTPTLRPGGDGPLRAREVLTGVGARGPGRTR